MQRDIVFLVVGFALVSAVRSEDVLKCYMCTSVTDEGCGDLTTHDLKPEECTLQKMVEWQRNIQQNKLLGPVAFLFELDMFQHYPVTPTAMACAKTNFKVATQDITIRSCQIAKTETIDPCKVMEGKLSGNIVGMEYCGLCTEDACNSSVVSSPTILYTLLSVFVALAAFFHGA